MGAGCRTAQGHYQDRPGGGSSVTLVREREGRGGGEGKREAGSYLGGSQKEGGEWFAGSWWAQRFGELGRGPSYFTSWPWEGRFACSSGLPMEGL